MTAEIENEVLVRATEAAQALRIQIATFPDLVSVEGMLQAGRPVVVVTYRYDNTFFDELALMVRQVNGVPVQYVSLETPAQDSDD
jgi:hypothetical protein